MHDESRKRLAARIFAPVAITLFAGFALFDLLFTASYFDSIAKLALLTLVLVNYLLYTKGRLSLGHHTDIILAIMTVLILYLVLRGVPGRGGALWIFIFPLIAFFVKGSRAGLVWTIILSGGVFFLCLLSRFGIAEFRYYKCQEIASMTLPYIALCVTVYIYEYFSSDYRKRLQLSEKFAEENRRFSYQVELARQVQMQIIPSHDVVTADYEVAFYYEPAYRIGGDYIDYFDINEDISAFVLCDVVGKGIPAALLMMSLRTLIFSLIKAGKNDPHDIIESANTMFHDDYEDDFYVTLSFILYEKKNKIVRFFNAGHSPFIYFSRVENRIKEIELEGVPIGLFKNNPNEVSVNLQMYTDDVIILFSDGLTDRINLRDLHNARTKLFSMVQENAGKKVGEMKDLIVHCCRENDATCDYKDDISFIIIKIL